MIKKRSIAENVTFQSAERLNGNRLVRIQQKQAPFPHMPKRGPTAVKYNATFSPRSLPPFSTAKLSHSTQQVFLVHFVQHGFFACTQQPSACRHHVFTKRT
jgi:hypothetical protein